MLRKIFLFNFIFFSPFFFMSNGFSMEIKIEEQEGKPPVIFLKPPKEKTAEEILEGLKDNPAYMGCAEWLKKERPDFSEDKVSSHALFFILKDAMSLADFEVDALEDFVHKYMETDMPKEQGESIKGLQENSMSAKNLVNQVINFLQGKETIEKTLKNYFTYRLGDIVVYQADLTRRSKTHIGTSKIERVERLTNTTDHRYTELEAAFLRSYNTKNKIIRDLIYHLKEQDPKPLVERLPPDLLDLLRLSPSLHPFLNKKDETWVNYDQALGMGEVRNFVGNAKQVNLDIREFFKKKNISGFIIPKVFKPLSALPLPSFVLEGKQKGPVYKIPSEIKKKKKKKATPSEKPQTLLKEEQKGIEEKESPQPIKEEPLIVKIVEKEEEVPPSLEVEEKESEIYNLDKEELKSCEVPQQASIKNEEEIEVKQTTKVSGTHATTIWNIFRLNGYKNLNDDKIISAWEHVLEDRGYHKDKTGRSHQPLYAALSDGSNVVLGLFRSSGYGSRYVKYIREAFDKIGFGQKWLEGQGYILN